MISDHCIIERRRSGFEVSRVGIGALIEQELDDGQIASPCRVVKRRTTQRIAFR